MKILLTGGSSFTGYWFAQELKSQGHQVICTLTRSELREYSEQKSYRRVQGLSTDGFEVAWGMEFGSEKFCALLESGKFDLICFHGAHIPDYRSQDFNLAESLSKNLYGIQNVFSVLGKETTPFILTGTVFENGEGASSDEGSRQKIDAASPYGLAKHLISEAFEYYAKRSKTRMAKFIVPNPVGPLEDKKFTAYLMECWKQHQKATVRTPLYVRDNIHVKLLAKVYAELATRLVSYGAQATETMIVRPSGYRESQGDFTKRFAHEMSSRLGLSCEYALAEQNEFSEPLSRVNSEPAKDQHPDFSEKKAWDEMAEYYR